MELDFFAHVSIAPNLGFPPLGASRELKRATEGSWSARCLQVKFRKQLITVRGELRPIAATLNKSLKSRAPGVPIGDGASFFLTDDRSQAPPDPASRRARAAHPRPRRRHGDDDPVVRPGRGGLPR